MELLNNAGHIHGKKERVVGSDWNSRQLPSMEAMAAHIDRAMVVLDIDDSVKATGESLRELQRYVEMLGRGWNRGNPMQSFEDYSGGRDEYAVHNLDFSLMTVLILRARTTTTRICDVLRALPWVATTSVRDIIGSFLASLSIITGLSSKRIILLPISVYRLLAIRRLRIHTRLAGID